MCVEIQKSNAYLAKKKKVKMFIGIGPFKVGLEIRSHLQNSLQFFMKLEPGSKIFGV